MSEEYINQLEETIEKMKKEMETLHAEKDDLEEKWRNHEIYDESEMWSLDYTLACIILPRLKRLKENKNGYPSELESPEQWDTIMENMIQAFELIVNDDSYPNGNSLEHKKTIEYGLKLFGEYFQSLWD